MAKVGEKGTATASKQALTPERPWIHVATRRIAKAAIVGAEGEMTVMTKLCEKYPRDEWELFATNFIGIEPNVVDVMFVFVAKN